MLFLLAVGIAPSLQPQTSTVDLFRGAKVNGTGYWAVEDTYLTSASPDKSMGGLFTLEGGKGRTILIKFGDLESAIPAGAKISKATLYLSPSSSDRPVFQSIGMLKAPWGEGPMFSATPGEADPVKWAATWKQRRSRKTDWQQSGATGPEDVPPIPQATSSEHEKEISIENLADAVQSMRDRWFENHGFAINFSGPCEFYSSQSFAGKPRLVVEYTLAAPAAGPDLSVQWLQKVGSGEGTAYRAIVKNVGSAAAAPFGAQWTVGEKTGSRFDVSKSLAPGEETEVELKKAARADHTDHRLQPILFRVFPAAAEANSNNDALEIQEDAIPVGFTGAKVSADPLQALARKVNDVYFAQSRFSYALEGVLDRIRLVPDQESAQIDLDLTGGPSDTEIVRQLLTKLTGLASQDPKKTIVWEDQTVAYEDPFSGISGFGDTRNESLLPPGLPIVYIPVYSPLLEVRPLEPTDLLSGIEVAAINMALGKAGKIREGVLWDLPATIILRATDLNGNPLDGAELSFYQLDGDRLPDTPTQTVLTKNGGTVILESKDVQTGIIDKDAIHTLKRNPFGDLRSNGTNGTILIRALINGETEWGWIKAWQLADAFHRGNRAASIVDVRFNAPSGPLDRSQNLAKDRLVTDVAESLPAKLAALVDENVATSVELGDKPGDWIEIDLGRDRPIGEVQIHSSSMPLKFDIQTYSTGQSAPTTEFWSKDLDSNWTRRNRGSRDGYVPYRGKTTRSRYIRIVNRSGGKGSLNEVKVYALKAQ
ncbi:MAG TPA: hypothetical protein VJ835_00895 [Fimbriimonadaceae bacterium]|nr:hypothetical protein [Fimbriimonadaceae bacterium]